MKNGIDKKFITIDGNEAVAYVAYRLNEVIAIYPITPASSMGEWSDDWASKQQPNLWGTVPTVVEMQSEGGAAGAVHGAIQTGALTTTFTSSQGLLLMIPNMYKIAGELTPTVFHVASRSLATQALSIFGDHSDVMAARATGFAMLCSASVQEAMDFALIAQAASLKSRLPFLHFFDGFRTSHEIAKIELIPDDVMRAMIDMDMVIKHRKRALSPDHPVMRGSTQNPDVYFQARETVNPYYQACPEIVQKEMDKFYQLTGRRYQLYEYYGASNADRVIVLMGSGCEAVQETVDYLNEHGERVGLLKVRLFRPFNANEFVKALPHSVKSIAVLDRTKEPGGAGEPLYLDVVTSISEMLNSDEETLVARPKIVCGRYGLSSKEFTPAMIKGIFSNLAQSKPKNHFTIGIKDDLSHTDLTYNKDFSIENNDVVRAIFYGLGSDGTVGANKNSIKIIGENTDHYAQGYFVYDSKKSGAVTISHLRFSVNKIRSPYLITAANFVACHQPVFLERYNMVDSLVPDGTFLLNTSYSADEIWHHLPRHMQAEILSKNIKLYVIDANKVAIENGMGGRINTIMQVCFFALANILPKAEAITAIKNSIIQTYGKKGSEIVEMNIKAVDDSLAHLYQARIGTLDETALEMNEPPYTKAPTFIKEVLGPIMAGCGNELPVSALPCDGTFPIGSAKWEKRNLATEIPVWQNDLCIQCGKCTIVCPHSAIRIKVYDKQLLEQAPPTFKSHNAMDREWKDLKYTIQVAPEDCTGCGICVEICPAKNKQHQEIKALNMAPQPPLRKAEQENWEYFLTLPEIDRKHLKLTHIRQQQLEQPLFEFSGACSGCGETPYIKLMTQLFGDRALVANATGCSSIFGGNLPTTPWTCNSEGRGPAWSNSLFEDNAEFGLGFRISVDQQRDIAIHLLMKLSSTIGDNLVNEIINAQQKDEADIYHQRERIAILKDLLKKNSSMEAEQLLAVADMLVKKSVWIIGGDGWAYDIGFGGLDHVLASGKDVNILVLDSEVYSNTGGQMSKSTPRIATAKFAAAGKPAPKKDLGLIAMSYGNVYVAFVAMGARDEHTLKAFLEAESYPGTSLIIAYSHCIAHGINDMSKGMQHQKNYVDSGQWLLYRFNPTLIEKGANPLIIDSRMPHMALKDALQQESRFNMLSQKDQETANNLLKKAQDDVNRRWQLYQYLSHYPNEKSKDLS